MVGLHISATSTPQVSLHSLSSLPIPRSQLKAIETAMANHQQLESVIEENSHSVSDAESDSDSDLDELDDNPDCYPGTCLRCPLCGSALKGSPKKRKAANIDVGANEPKKKSSNLSRPASPRSSPDALNAPDGPIYSRETYTEEKDAMIRFLRDNLENTWPVVAQLYDEYWGTETQAPPLTRWRTPERCPLCGTVTQRLQQPHLGENPVLRRITEEQSHLYGREFFHIQAPTTGPR
jgi:rubrerythrin